MLSYNLGGSHVGLEWALDTDADVVVLQETRLDPSLTISKRRMAEARGWHGLWRPCAQTKHGRSGGFAILARKEVPLFAAGPDEHPRFQHIVLPWTRQHKLHVFQRVRSGLFPS